MTKVSIIMPAYNVEHFIKESMLSIKKQAYLNWELIIIDDGSTDDTIAVAQSSKEGDERIQIYSQSNKGVSVARNLGLSIATGSYIAFLDGDDLWHPLFLSKMVDAIVLTKEKLAICGFKRLYPNGSYSGHDKQYLEGAIFLSAIQDKLAIHIGSLLVSKKLLDRFSIRFTEKCMISEDVELIYKILTVTEAAVVREELMTYRKRLGSTTQVSWKWKSYITSIYARERVLAFAEEHYEQIDKEQVLCALAGLISYLKCDFLWKGVKFGEHALIHDLIDKGWRDDLRAIDKGEIRFSKRLKYKIVLSQNSFLWTQIYRVTSWMNTIRQQLARQ